VSDVDAASLAALLDECRAELTAAVDELERSRAAHRTVESLLLAVLDHVPVPFVVVDAEGRLRAVSAAAQETWGAQLGDLAAGVRPLGDAGVPELCRVAVEAGHVPAATVPPGFDAALLHEPGTDTRYVAVWGAS
jgi:PAS domain-containing protein